LTVSVFTILFSVVAASSAAASLPPVQENLSTVADHAARGGAVEVPGSTCGPACDDLWTDEHSPEPGAQTERELNRQLRTLRIAAKVLPAVKTLSRADLMFGTFEIGWRIGTGINTKWLRIGLPERTPSNLYGGNQAITFVDGATTAINARTPFVSWSELGQSNGVWRWSFDSGRINRLVAGPCKGYMPAPPAGFSETSTFTTVTWCTSDGTSKVAAYYRTEDELPAPGPIEDYSGQPYRSDTPSWQGQQTDRSGLENDVNRGLAQTPLLEAWHCHRAAPKLCATSPQLESSREQCELTDALGADPAPERDEGDSTVTFKRRYESVPATALPPEAAWPVAGVEANGAPLGLKAHLRWGYTARLANVYSDWGGWGYRHIAAKHGWTKLERDATVEALSRPPVAVEHIDDRNGGRVVDRHIYHGPVYSGRYGAECVRAVAVEFDYNDVGGDNRWSDEIANGTKSAGIITSFGLEVK